MQNGMANFALFSAHAEKVTLGLFQNGHPIKEIPLQKTGDVWHVGIEGLPENLEYAYRCDGPKDHLYKPDAWLIDPRAKLVRNLRAVAAMPAPFDWEGDAPPRIRKEDLIIYEMHVRGFTKHPSSGVQHPGTYLGVIEKIPHLKKLGINAVELMPLFGFDPTYTKKINPKTGQKLVNYWGYNTLHFFAPMAWYAEKDPLAEFKTLVRELHKNGIEVILDVVYNHTGEENDLSYYVHFRGIDNCVYYILSPDGHYMNYTGCWNTVNANHPAVSRFILDSLRYWVEEMHVDGFRFDLASIFTRDPKGLPLSHPPLLDLMNQDPVLKKVKWIAEAWDAAGLYQLGSFPKWGPWSEWNGHYRDTVRRFLKGDAGHAGSFASVQCGSEMIYASSKTPLSSVNFITAHDGYTLRDLVSYQSKHNLENGEENRDGNNQNDSWNCGVEGETKDPAILALRERQMRNFLLALFVAQGIPMLFMGDEYGHTRYGNNNPYGQDNELNWFLWNQQDEKKLLFLSSLIAFRKQHPALRHTQFLVDAEVNWFTNWDAHSHGVAYQLKAAPSLYIAFNASAQTVTLPLPKGNWQSVVNTADDWQWNTKGPLLTTLQLIPYSASILQESSSPNF
ncbi:MAG: isoamylase [Verrucomicrobia bacterium]|nr:isoamylase [Verrucomicrobiota bacterium]MDE3047248.1 glycogen-debranching protein [Verrucomicrobiota bacterium]